MNEKYLNEDNLYDVFDNVENIVKFLYKISMSILNKDMYEYIENDSKKLIQNDIINQMNMINLIDDKTKFINKASAEPKKSVSISASKKNDIIIWV